MMSLINSGDFVYQFIPNRYRATNKFNHNFLYLLLHLLNISLKHHKFYKAGKLLTEDILDSARESS